MLERRVDYVEVSTEAYYLSLLVSDRFFDLLDKSFHSKAQAARIVGVKSATFSNVSLLRSINSVLKYAKPLNMNVKYLLTGEEKYKNLGYEEVNPNMDNVFKVYNENKHKVNCTNLTPIIHAYKYNKDKRIRLRLLYTLSLIYNKSILWLIGCED